MRRLVLLAVALALAIAACGGDAEPPTEVAPGPSEPATPAPEPPMPDQPEQLFPDIIDARAQRAGDNSLRFDVTISSPYDSPERYADAWRVLDESGNVLGVRELLHDHANEQPFTRSLDGVEVPADVRRVTIEGRDLVNGWGGQTLELDLPPPTDAGDDGGS